MTITELPPTLTDQPLVLNPAISVIRSTDDEIVAHLGSRSRTSHRISDSQGRGRLADFVAGFVRPVSPAALAQEQDLDPAVAAEFVEHLTQGKVLIPEEQTRYSYLITGLGLTPSDTDLQVGVLGSGAIATAVARQLGDLIGTPVLLHDDAEAAFDGADLVVVASDQLAPGLCYDADEISLATGIPWQLVYLDGFELMIGPTFVPGESANYYDVDAMDEAARVLRTQYLYEKSSHPDQPRSATVPTFVADLAASWATTAIAQHLWGSGSFLEGYVMRVDLERMQIMREKVLRLPRNPVEMGVRSDLRHPFL